MERRRRNPDGEAPDSNGQAPDSAGQTEEITLDDIKEGDVVAITLDDDGNAATITVQSTGMGGGPGGPSALTGFRCRQLRCSK